MTTVALYARYSTDLQSAASIADQLRLCEQRAAQEGWQVYRAYSDGAISGASLHRPGIQDLLRDAQAGRFTIVLAEALDRISRDQEDIAAVFKRLRFAGAEIVTLSEGPVSELHVGLKGTMNALFLKDLADKTRRGLSGRVQAGFSGGGKSYGYDVVKRLDQAGEPITGERTINEAEAAIVRRIMTAYASGQSPRHIAIILNKEGIPGPTGKGWTPSTIHGNRQRGTGILNNELYIGRLVWNRLRYMKDPVTGKRQSRLNPPETWQITDVPHLRIVDDQLWQAVKDRQSALTATTTGDTAPGYWHRRRPKYLFTGKMVCGACKGSFVNFNKVYVGCFNARNRGTCTNKATMRRADLEAAVLQGLESRLLDDELMKLFCEEYTRALKKLQQQRSAGRAADEAALARTTRELDRLVQALLDGVPASHVKAKMAELAARKEVLEKRLAETPDDNVVPHPNMAAFYREQIRQLRTALTDPHYEGAAAEELRGLIERIILSPHEEDGAPSLTIRLEGDLAGILTLASNAKTPPQEDGVSVEVTKLVAGARNHLVLLIYSPDFSAWRYAS